VTRESYGQDIDSAVKVLEGRDSEVTAILEARMEEAASRLEFERAAVIRDQLATMKRVLADQIVTSEGERDVDVFAIVGEPGEYCISVMLVRGGRNLGTSSYFPRAALAEPEEAMSSFIMQYYATQEPPPEVLVGRKLEDADALAQALTGRITRNVHVRCPVRGLGVRYVELTQENATQALRMRVAQKKGMDEMFAALTAELDLPETPARIECFDISHTGGEGTVASCVVFGPEGPLKKEYRRFNITGVTPGDDYGALRQALERRYARIKDGEIPAPDLLLIDGGLGQINQVHEELETLGFGDMTLVGVAKGPDRKAGQERLFVYGIADPHIPEAHSPASRLIQRIRDEAHRFAITGHRRKRAKRYNESILESIPGLGPAKRRQLLKHFGGLQGVLRAGIADFEKVAGIGASLARSLYDHLHPGD
jgi:excinuclease ABC subunit C